MGDHSDAANGQDKWDRVAAELRACRESQQRAYGDIDSTTLGRYLAGESGPNEVARVEAALEALPELRALAEIVRDVLEGSGAVTHSLPADDTATRKPAKPAARPAAAVLPMKSASQPRRPLGGFWQRNAALLAAACLLLAVGAGGLLLNHTSPEAPHAGLSVGKGIASTRGPEALVASLPALSTGKAAEEVPDIHEASVAVARETVVQSLAQQMDSARNPKERRKLATALGKFGPASTRASDVLVARLLHTNDCKEREAVLRALENMGPAARDALPRLRKAVDARKLDDKKEGHVRLRTMVWSPDRCRYWRVGVYDPAGRLSVKAANQTNGALRRLAEKHGIEVYVEVRPSAKGRYKAPEDLAREMGEKAAVVVLDTKQHTVKVWLSEALRGRAQARQASAAIKAALTKKGCDAAVSEACERLISSLAK